MAITNTNLTLMVKDIDRSVAFYLSIGFELVNRWGNHYAQLSAPGIVIGLHPASHDYPAGSGNASIGLTSDNFDATVEMLKKLAVPAEYREEEGGKFIHFSDSDGTLIYFIQPKGY